MDCEDLLYQWGMPDEIVQNFKENFIAKTSFKTLYSRKDLLSELISPVGLRLTFEEKLGEWLNAKEISEMSTETDTSTSSIEKLQEGVLPSGSSENIIDLTNISFDLSILNETFPSFDLNTLLTTSALGKSILKYYETFQKLNNSQQNRLVDIMVKHIYNFIVKSPPSHADYNKMVSKIINLFPNENSGTYYIPAISKADSTTGRSQKAMGKLPNIVRNIRFLSGDTRKRRNKNDDNDSSSVIGGKNKRMKLNDLNIDPDLHEDWLWLKTNTEPWSSVVEKWQRTFSQRKMYAKTTAAEFYEDWPILNDLRAHILINMDFEMLYPEHHLNFHLNWKNFMDDLISKRGNQLRNTYAIEVKDAIQENSGDIIPAQLFLLNHIVPPTGKVHVGKTIWKFSTLESIEGIFLHIKEAGDINRAIHDKEVVASQKGRKVQPYLIFIGPSIIEINQSFLIVDKIKYEFDNSAKAVDTLYKIFHVLNLHYPPESEHIYLIIQKGIYKINTAFDKNIPSIMDIISC